MFWPIGVRGGWKLLAREGDGWFDDFTRGTKTTDAIAAARLNELGLFPKEPYRERGKRTARSTT